MEIQVNGVKRKIAQGLTVNELLTVLGLSEQKIAIECNLEIVPRSLWLKTKLQNGDSIEIINFVGGG